MAKKYDSAHEMLIDLAKTYTASIETNHGTITIAFDSSRSPQTVNNFVTLARDGFYDGVIFHRVIEGFMIQGGDPTGTGSGGPGYRFRDEIEGSGVYDRGTVAMANSGPNTNGSQFFIMQSDYSLPHQYTIFGKVTDGLDTIDTIATTDKDRGDKPLADCTIEKVTISES